MLYANTHIATCHPLSCMREIIQKRGSEVNETLPEYLRQAWKNARENLSSKQSEQVKTLLMKHKAFQHVQRKEHVFQVLILE